MTACWYKCAECGLEAYLGERADGTRYAKLPSETPATRPSEWKTMICTDCTSLIGARGVSK